MIAAGDRLRDLREDKGKTQAEISSLLGTTQQIYSRYETNRTDLPLRHLIKLADYYQVSADPTRRIRPKWRNHFLKMSPMERSMGVSHPSRLPRKSS